MKIMIELPILLKSLIPEYRPYTRHHSNGEGEIGLYAML